MSYQREFERRLNVGFVGVGGHSYRNLLPTTNFLPVTVRAICDLDESRAQSTAAQFGANAYTSADVMYLDEDLDAVFIAVSPQRHPELVMQAFEAGAHVWCEKPPAMRASDVSKMIAARGDWIAVVGFKKSFMPATRKVIEWFSQDGHSPIRTILGEYPMTIPDDGEAILQDGRYVNWLANGCHPLSFMLEVGGEVEAVTTHRNRWGGGVCVLEYATGALGNLHLSDGGKLPLERYVVYGNGTHAVVDNIQRVSFHRGIPFQYGRTTDFSPQGFDHGTLVWEPQNSLSTLENRAEFTQGIYSELFHFCESVLNGTQSTIGTLEFAHHLMQVYEAGLVSNGARVEIER
ncbi:MAG: Gfo/Idh/MocA family oxidoreductase [Candidatus Poribacteria bacterium]|nr:Gfo/Idh/MocA family oxidoreductase [Candidatus Poribacteria bacterium]